MMFCNKSILLAGTVLLAISQLGGGFPAAAQQVLVQADHPGDANDPHKKKPGSEKPQQAPAPKGAQQPTPAPAPKGAQQPPPAPHPKGAQQPVAPQPKGAQQPAPAAAPAAVQQPPAAPKGAEQQDRRHREGPQGKPSGAPPQGPAAPQSTQQQPPAQPRGAPEPRRDQHQETQRPQTPQQSPAQSQTSKPVIQPGAAPQQPTPAAQQPQPGTAPQRPAPTAQQAQPGVGARGLEDLRGQRKERVENNGQRVIIEEPDHRMIVRENGRVFIRHDESERFRMPGQDARVEQHAGETWTVVRRPDDVEIVTVVDADGRLVRRFRRTRGGQEFILIDNRARPGIEIGIGGFAISLAPPRISIPREQYIVEMEAAPPQMLMETLEAPPVERLERAYSLDEIRYSMAVRDRMRRIDLDTITFDTGSWQITEDQAPRLERVAEAINAIVKHNPNEMFLIEGHTDAVGSDEDNLSLSDHRASSVAEILSQDFQVPPENLTTQGYGAHELKVQTQEASRANRRVTIRRITPLLSGAAR